MRRSLTALILGGTLLLASGGVGYSQDLEKAWEAYEKGDYATALREYSVLAEQGDANAQFRLGVMYVRGEGVTQDYKEAVKWARKSAEQGHAGGQFNLGVLYDYGSGVTRDYKEAVKWYRKSAEQEYAKAQSNLGVMYEYGRGVTRDYKEAVEWFRKSAEQGYAFGQYALGVMYENGWGVLQDSIYAHMWWNIAASNGNVDAMKFRDSIAKKMNKEQLEKANEMARRCVDFDYKDCDAKAKSWWKKLMD